MRKVKVYFTLADRQYHYLEKIAEKRGITIQELLRIIGHDWRMSRK